MPLPKFIFKTLDGKKLHPSGTYYSTILERIPEEGIKPIDIKRADYPYDNTSLARGWHTDDWRKMRNLGLINMDKRRAYITGEGKRLLKELSDFNNSPVTASDVTSTAPSLPEIPDFGIDEMIAVNTHGPWKDDVPIYITKSHTGDVQDIRAIGNTDASDPSWYKPIQFGLPDDSRGLMPNTDFRKMMQDNMETARSKGLPGTIKLTDKPDIMAHDNWLMISNQPWSTKADGLVTSDGKYYVPRHVLHNGHDIEYKPGIVDLSEIFEPDMGTALDEAFTRHTVPKKK